MKVYPTETGVAEERTGGSLRARFLISRAFKSLWVSMGIIIEIILIIIILQLPSRPMPLFDCTEGESSSTICEARGKLIGRLEDRKLLVPCFSS